MTFRHFLRAKFHFFPDKFQITHLNAYHMKVRERLTPLLQQENDRFTINWLEKETQPIKA